MGMISTFLDLTIRVGCHLTYEATAPTPVVFMLRPRLDDAHLVSVELDDMNAQIRRYSQLHEDLQNTAQGSKRWNKEQVRLALRATEELLYLILAQERPN